MPCCDLIKLLEASIQALVFAAFNTMHQAIDYAKQLWPPVTQSKHPTAFALVTYDVAATPGV